ncbi:MAG TPA: riboflavin kinase [Candidatus Paceibacterota bacterium]|uniref:riboflavin kinase n=1 Tax=Candidatus Ryanbacteria bacterium RIFCSPHIGHO2_01_FULL_45_22 TaxID=1802114 RepID=A0A1G2G1P9_9BACT|nr:MAG: hypothetical protein A2719_00235 [Candidatus Ryanbacteria bacterium RIFCSPHIGHO2_01_FULL_45_22]
MQKFTGVAVKGEGRATQLGFPTANIPLTDDFPSGIYAGKVTREGQDYLAAIYADIERNLLEAHLLDFSGDLTGETLVVIPIKKIRESKKFENDEALRAAIENDIRDVRRMLET